MMKDTETEACRHAATPHDPNDAVRRVLSAASEALPFPPPARLLVGLSGGADSVALLRALRLLGYPLEAAHCNFHLRGEESDRDEEFVRNLCEGMGINLHRVHFETTREANQSGESIEMAARRLRYTWFAQVVRQTGCRALAVAHHASDNAETFFINLLRGTGLRGLTGMSAERTTEEEMCVVRPLLQLTRLDIERFLKALGQDFMTDSTNKDTQYRRNKIRHEIMPVLRTINPDMDRSLTATMHRLAGTQALADYAVSALRSAIAIPVPGGLRIDLAAWKNLPLPPCGREALLHEFLRPFGFSPSAGEDIAQGISRQTGAVYESPSHLATRDRGFLEIRERPTRFAAKELPLEGDLALPNGLRLRIRRMERGELENIPHDLTTACLDADSLCGPLTCRSVETGDRFRPFGMAGTKLVSDLLTERKRSRIEKMAATVICDARGIIWLTAERPAARCAVTASTRRVVLITAENDAGQKPAPSIAHLGKKA